MTPILYIIATAIAIFFILLGWSSEGIIFKLSLIIGGLYLGFLITEALNYKE